MARDVLSHAGASTTRLPTTTKAVAAPEATSYPTRGRLSASAMARAECGHRKLGFTAAAVMLRVAEAPPWSLTKVEERNRHRAAT